MERLEKLVNILKLTPHRQPELVKEAANIITTRHIRNNSQVGSLLKPLLEILIQYCDNDDSAQRSLFNDYLNNVVLAYQYQHYQLILLVFIEEVANNGSVRTITAALLRISYLVRNVQPIELGCEPQKLLKALIEVARRSEDESVQKALDSTLKHVMAYLDYHVRKSKEMQLLTKSLIEILLRNLQSESSQVKRLAASSLANVCLKCESQLKTTIPKLESQLKQFLEESSDDVTSTNKFVGLCFCVKEIPNFAEQHYTIIVEVIIKQIQLKSHDTAVVIAAMETLREMYKYPIKPETVEESAKLIIEKFLLSEEGGVYKIKEETKVILQSNALACLASIVTLRPKLLENLEYIFLFSDHPDVAVRNQVMHIIGNYIDASWKFPQCIDQSVDCGMIRKLWLQLKATIRDENSHPDTLKSCLSAIKTCINTLLESDHCLHIVEYQDFTYMLQLFNNSNSKPFKIEALGLFANLNYRTLYYLERSHWSKMRAQTASSLVDSLQDQILEKIVIASLTDEHPLIRSAAASALISMIPNLYITGSTNGPRTSLHRCSDPLVSLAEDLANEHLIVMEQADEQMDLLNEGDEALINLELHDRIFIRYQKLLSSSIVQSHTSERACVVKNSQKVIISINLMYTIGLLKTSLEKSLDKGKAAISSIVSALYKLSLSYPVHQYSVSWDCRPSEHCECSTLLNLLLTYLENINEPDVIVEDLQAYRHFLALSHQLLYALCHESVLHDYEHQKMKPFHKRADSTETGSWSELVIKPSCIADILQNYFTHITKLLLLISNIIEGRANPFGNSAKVTPTHQGKPQVQEFTMNHGTLVSNRLFSKIYRKLESSFKSSKKNLNQRDEKFYQIMDTTLSSVSSLLEFMGMSKSLDYVKDILSCLQSTSTINCVASLICARQLLKSLFGINILALYQVDPIDWFEEESGTSSTVGPMPIQENSCSALQSVYHFLVSKPYKIFNNYHSTNYSQITPASDKTLAAMNYESRRALKVRRRIEERVKSLFELNPNQLISPKVKQIGEILKNTITEFTTIVTDCMSQFNQRGFHQYQSEVLHLMSYLILLRVNYRKLALASDLLASINKLLDNCGEKMFVYHEAGLDVFLRTSFTFLALLTYERGQSKPMFQVATIIQRLDDLRAKLSMTSPDDHDITTYVVPLLRCLVEDLFIYRTEHELEAERETVAQKLLDIIDNPGVYDLLSILILESRRNSSEIKYKKLSQHLLSIIPHMLSERSINLVDYERIELTRKIIESISPEVFQPVKFIIETLLESPKPTIINNSLEFQRWMSLVLITIHILTTQVKEEVFLSRIRETMSEEDFVEYLLHIAQLCLAEILVLLSSPTSSIKNPTIIFLTQQLSSYMLYLTHMFQSGLFFQLSRSAADLIKRQLQSDIRGPKSFEKLCLWARDPNNGICLNACETMFFQVRLLFPDLTIFWCNIMMLLNYVDCNRYYWRNLLVYECHHCQTLTDLSKAAGKLSIGSSGDDTPLEEVSEEVRFKRSGHVNRPSSLNLSDISFSDQLRRSFIKKIATSETKDKVALNRNIIETSDEDGQLLEREVNIGNVEQCLAPNIELTRRGALCLVLDFVTISMNDVEHITWLIIHHINDIIRWSHETPIAEFINAVHGNSGSSGIFIQAINSGFNNLTSISFVTRLLWTLEKVHYTQYGSLVILLTEKLLASEELTPYRSLTRKIENFACETVQKLLNETNKSLVTTNDEVINQLTAEDLDRVISILDSGLYPRLTKLMLELRKSTQEKSETPTIQFHQPENSIEDGDSDIDDIEVLRSKINLVFWLAEQSHTAQISTLLPALSDIKKALTNLTIVDCLNNDEELVCSLISALYSLALNILPPPTRLTRPKFWLKSNEGNKVREFIFDERPISPIVTKPSSINIGSRRTVAKPKDEEKPIALKKTGQSKSEKIEDVRMACLKGLFLLENIDCLKVTQFECITDLIIYTNRLPLVNSFILTPPELWRQNIWPTDFEETDEYKTTFPIIPHEILSKDYGLLENFCDRLLRLGWISRRQFEEAWMTLLGVLSTSLSSPESNRTNLKTSCKVIYTITKLLSLTQKHVFGDPLSEDNYAVKSFDDRVAELTKAISSNLTSLRKKTSQLVLEDVSKKELFRDIKNDASYNYHLKIPAQELRINSILNLDMQDTVLIEMDKDGYGSKIDVESCIRLLISIYRQKFKDPDEEPVGQQRQRDKNKSNQLPPPLLTAICESILTLSDMFTDYEQFDWLFKTFVDMFKVAERNEDEIQMLNLVVGLSKAASICCYEIPSELTIQTTNWEVMFEKCKQSIDRCLKSDFGPLKLNALFALYYMLEDSINIVASGAWELDDFRHLRRSRLTWILRLMPTLLNKENCKQLTKKQQTIKLLELLYETISESELVYKYMNK